MSLTLWHCLRAHNFIKGTVLNNLITCEILNLCYETESSYIYLKKNMSGSSFIEAYPKKPIILI